MITYTNIIESIKYHKIEGNLQNVIKSVTVFRVGTHTDGYEKRLWERLYFDTPHESQFVPFNEITQEMLLSWIENHPSGFNQKAEEYISKMIQAEIDSNEVETTVLPSAQIM